MLYKKRLMTPGPTEVPPTVLAQGGQPIIHHRTPQFRKVLTEVVAGLKRIFNTELVFNQKENRLVFEERYLSQSIFLANNELLDALQQFAQEQLNKLKSTNEWSNKVKRRIGWILLNGDKPGIETISQDLNISTRSLQNKLKNESVSYQILLDEVRKEISLSYIERPDTTINDLAFILAFSDQSAFSHSFKRWTGKSPLEYRKTLSYNN